MNAAMASAVRTQAANPETAGRIERETVKSAEQAAGGQNIAFETSVSSKYDTLELSRKYLEYRTQTESKTLQDETSQLNSTIVKKASDFKDSSDVKNTTDVKNSSDAKDSSDVENSSDNSSKKLTYYNPMYSYTEFELKEMLDDGIISKSQYESQLAEEDISFEAG